MIQDVWKYVKATVVHCVVENAHRVPDAPDVKVHAQKNVWKGAMIYVKVAVAEHVLIVAEASAPDVKVHAPDVVEDARAAITHVWAVLDVKLDVLINV